MRLALPGKYLDGIGKRLNYKNKRTMIGDHFTYFFRQDPVIIDLIKKAEADFAIDC